MLQAEEPEEVLVATRVSKPVALELARQAHEARRSRAQQLAV